MSIEQKKIALVTGANRGIGYEISKALASKGILVILGCRSEDYAKEAIQLVKEQVPNSSLDYCIIDISDEKSMENATKLILEKYGHIDILVNNAGILNNGNSTIMDITITETLEHIKVNALGPMKLCQLFLPVMIKRNYGRIVNVSSISGSIGNLLVDQKYRPFPESDYRISKATLNMVTSLFEDYIRPNGVRPNSAEPRPNILINSVCPGFCRTRMGGPTGELSAEEGAEMAVYLATLLDDGPSGKFFRGKEELAW